MAWRTRRKILISTQVQTGHGPAIAVAMVKHLTPDAEQPAERDGHAGLGLQRALRDPLGIIIRNILPLRARHAVVVRRDADGALERVRPRVADDGLLLVGRSIHIFLGRVRDDLQ